MGSSKWDWRPGSSRPECIANLHLCRALLRIYRSVRLPIDDMDMTAVARAFWPLLRRHPQELLAAVSQYRWQGTGRRRRRQADPDEADGLRAWFVEQLKDRRQLPMQAPDGLEPVGEGMLQDAASFRPVLDAVAKDLSSLISQRPLPVERRLGLLAKLLQLNRLELGFLRLCACAELGTLGTGPFGYARSPTRMIQAVQQAILAPDEHTVRAMFRRDSRLARSGLLDRDSFGSCHDMEDLLRLSRNGSLLLGSGATTAEQMAELILKRLPNPGEDALDWTHLEDRTGLLVRILRHGLAKRASGINILLYGTPGTGKTEYARRLVESVGADGFAVVEMDADGDPASRSERLSSLMLTQVFAPPGHSIVVLDEAEDIFQADYNHPLARVLGKPEDSKAWMNSLLECNRNPVIWVSNRVEHIDPAYLRRFTYCLEFPTTPRRVREKIAQMHLEPVGCTPEAIRSIALVQAASPALVASAARIASLAKLGAGEVDQGVKTALKDMLSAAGAEFVSSVPERSTRFDLRYLRVSGPVSAAQMIEGLARAGRGRAILSGPAGTGKTQLAAEVAAQLGRELVYRSASDINSMWFGESERKVARMFRECDPQGEVLFLDEADTLLGSRDSAQNRAEHAVTAEFLRQVEAFAGVFVCATNYATRVDAALLRRFEFRLELLPLDARQRFELFCETAFDWSPQAGKPLPELAWNLRARLDRLTLLTPGDYANVIRRTKTLRLDLDAAGWLEHLESEHAVKPQAGRATMGFV